MNDGTPTASPTARSGGARFNFSNFDYLRLLAASAVVLTHAFSISQGDIANEPLQRVLGGGMTLGVFGVLIFFAISGFLVTHSATNSAGVGRFVWHRFLRIYPAFFVCLLFCGFFVGTLFSTDLHKYLTELHPVRYVVHSIVELKGQSALTVRFVGAPPGFDEGLNGSLWTIRYEVFC